MADHDKKKEKEKKALTDQGAIKALRPHEMYG
jgi:hypothetical protein